MKFNSYVCIFALAAALFVSADIAMGCDSCGCTPKSTSDCCGSCGGHSKAAAKWDGQGRTIVDIATKAGSFNTLVTAVKAAGLAETLMGEGPYTVFAPTDEAFAKLPAGTVQTLLKTENRAKLQSILTYHVVPRKAVASDVVRQRLLSTVNGLNLDVMRDKQGVTIGNSRILKTDIMASNGVIHVIDTVLLPPREIAKARLDIVDTAVNAKTFNTLVAAVKSAGLVETLKGDGPFTVFAPSDEAFAKLPAGTVESLLQPENRKQLISILTYHVVPMRLEASDVVKLKASDTVNGLRVSIKIKGGMVMIDNARVIQTDINAKNGVIHVIDSVILPQ